MESSFSQKLTLVLITVFQVKIWFQNHRYKTKKLFKEKGFPSALDAPYLGTGLALRRLPLMVRERLAGGVQTCPTTPTTLSSSLGPESSMNLHSPLSLHSSPVTFPGFLSGLLGSPVFRHCSPLSVTNSLPNPAGLHPALAASLLFPPHPLLHSAASLPPSSMPSLGSNNSVASSLPQQLLLPHNNSQTRTSSTSMPDTVSGSDTFINSIKQSASPSPVSGEDQPSSPNRW